MLCCKRKKGFEEGQRKEGRNECMHAEVEEDEVQNIGVGVDDRVLKDVGAIFAIFTGRGTLSPLQLNVHVHAQPRHAPRSRKQQQQQPVLDRIVG